MRRALLLLLPMLAGGCDRAPSFDERYDAQAANVAARAAAMQEEADARIAASNAAGRGAPAPAAQ